MEDKSVAIQQRINLIKSQFVSLNLLRQAFLWWHGLCEDNLPFWQLMETPIKA